MPLSFVFVLPHSLMPPARLYSLAGVGKYGRLLYNLQSAVSLHFLLSRFTPLASPVVMVLPIPPTCHVALSAGCLAFALFAFVFTPGTWGLLGAGRLLGWSRAWSTNPEQGMDAITWMGVTAWRWGGAGAFVLFTGVSIIPARLSLGDCITRCVAAVYLRRRSKSFREWVDKIEGAHLMTWVLRASLLGATLWSMGSRSTSGGDGGSMSPGWVLACACALVGILRVAEGHGRGGGGGGGKEGKDSKNHDEIEKPKEEEQEEEEGEDEEGISVAEVTLDTTQAVKESDGDDALLRAASPAARLSRRRSSHTRNIRTRH